MEYAVKNDELKFDYSELRGLIRQYFGTNEKYAEAIGISEVALYDRLAGRVDFKQKEMLLSKKFFQLDADGLLRVFYTLKSKKI